MIARTAFVSWILIAGAARAGEPKKVDFAHDILIITVIQIIGQRDVLLFRIARLEIQDSRLTPESLSQLLDLVESGAISGKTAKYVFEQMFSSGRLPAAIVKESDLGRLESPEEILEAIAKVVEEWPKAVADYKSGKETATKFLVGQVMRETRGAR